MEEKTGYHSNRKKESHKSNSDTLINKCYVAEHFRMQYETKTYLRKRLFILFIFVCDSLIIDATRPNLLEDGINIFQK